MTLPPLQLLLNAVLMLCVSLVQGVATMFGMRRRSEVSDWHTDIKTDALPQTKPDIHIKEILGPPGACLAALKRSESGPAVDAQRRTQTLTQTTNATTPTESFSALSRESFFALAASQKDARVKPEHGAIGVARLVTQEKDPLKVRVPRGGGDPVLRAAQTHSHRSALTRADQTPACAGETVERVARRKSA